MIPHGLEISIVGGGADEKDEGNRGAFYFYFYFYFYIIYSLLRYKKSHGALAMVKTKPKIQNELRNEISGPIHPRLGSVPVPGPHTGTKLQQVYSKKPSLNQRTP